MSWQPPMRAGPQGGAELEDCAVLALRSSSKGSYRGRLGFGAANEDASVSLSLASTVPTMTAQLINSALAMDES